MNKVILKGRLTKDPEIRYGNDEKCFANFSIAIEDRTWMENGTPHVDFIPCKAIGNIAQVVEKYLAKGKEVLLFGKLRSGKYKNHEGKTIYTLEFMVFELEFCGKKENNSYEGNFEEIPNGIEDELPFC